MSIMDNIGNPMLGKCYGKRINIEAMWAIIKRIAEGEKHD